MYFISFGLAFFIICLLSIVFVYGFRFWIHRELNDKMNELNIRLYYLQKSAV